MAKKITLEQVSELASQLSGEDRLKLFSHLAALPDSGLVYHPPVSEPMSIVLPSGDTQEVLAMNVQLGWGVTEDGTRIYSYEGREVLRIKFNPANYAESSFHQLKDKALQFDLTKEGRNSVRTAFQEYTRERGISPTEEQFQTIEKEVVQQHAQQLLRGSLEELANNINAHLHDVTFAILAKILQTSGFSVANLLRDTLQVPERKIKASDIQSMIYKPEFEQIKTIVGLRTSQGGARNVKHVWSDAELGCLAKTYQELRPVWLEAKQIARAAKSSKVLMRRKNWRDEVLRAFPDLPSELIDRLNHLQADDAKPSDIAIVHAKTKCGVTETYSARELREKIKAWNLKAKSRTSPKSSKAWNLKNPA